MIYKSFQLTKLKSRSDFPERKHFVVQKVFSGFWFCSEDLEADYAYQTKLREADNFVARLSN